MASNTSLIFDIFAKDHNTSQVFKGIEGSASGLGKTLSSALGPLGLGLGAGIGIAEFAKGLGEAVKAAGDFQAANTRLVTSAGESEANLKLVGDGILQIAQDTGTTVENLQQGAYYIESAGYHGADMLNVLKAAAQGAKAEGSDVATVGDAVTSALRDYHLPASQAADVTSKLITATSQGKTTFELFSGSLHSVLPLASAAHISLNDILGDLASMTVHGMSADQATQNLNDTIRHMLNPTQQQAKEFALFGLTVQGVSDSLSSNGLSGTLDMLQGKITAAMPPGSDKVLLDMKTALSELDPKVQELGQHLFDGSMGWKEWMKQALQLDPVHEKQITQLATLLGSTHSLGNEQLSGETVLQNYAQAWRLLTGDATGANTALMITGENADYTHGAIQAISGATKDASGNVKGWADIQDNFNTKLDRAKEVFETTAIKIGTKLLPALGDAIGGFVDFFNKVSPLLGYLWDKDIKPAMDEIAGSFVKLFGDGSSDSSSTTGQAADSFKWSQKNIGQAATDTMGSDGTVAKAAKDFGDTMTAIAGFIKGAADAWVPFDEGTRNAQGVVHNYVWAMDTDWAEALMSMIVHAENFRSDVIVTMATAVGGMEDSLMSGFAGMIGDVENFRWTIIGDFADAEGWLVDAGNQIVMGLINGMGAMAQQVADTAANLANNAVQAAKTALGIHSPSRVFHEIGANLGLGLVNGIDSMVGPSGAAVGRLATASVGAFDMSPALVGAGSSGSFGSGAPQPLYLVLENGQQLKGYVSTIAGQAIDNADFRGARRPSL